MAVNMLATLPLACAGTVRFPDGASKSAATMMVPMGAHTLIQVAMLLSSRIRRSTRKLNAVSTARMAIETITPVEVSSPLAGCTRPGR